MLRDLLSEALASALGRPGRLALTTLGTVLGGQLGAGRWFDGGHSARADSVVVLGAALAHRLRVNDLARQPVVFVDDRPYSVVGILAESPRYPALLGAVVLPEGNASRFFGLVAPTSVYVRTHPGTAAQVAEQAALAVAPHDPARLSVLVAKEPRDTITGVTNDLQVTLLVLGGIALVIGVVGIANTTLVSVLERVSEIGLRRGLGATRRQIATTFGVGRRHHRGPAARFEGVDQNGGWSIVAGAGRFRSFS